MELCPFCRTPGSAADDDEIKRIDILMEKGNADAFYQLAGFYKNGDMGLPQDETKANELYLKAGQLGCADGYFNLGIAYYNGKGVEIDKTKVKLYLELAAMMGDVSARNNLGVMEYNVGNHERAFKHNIIAARAGDSKCLENVKNGFMTGLVVTKNEYESTLRAYHETQIEMKSEARDKAAVILAEIDASRSRSGA